MNQKNSVLQQSISMFWMTCMVLNLCYSYEVELFNFVLLETSHKTLPCNAQNENVHKSNKQKLMLRDTVQPTNRIKTKNGNWFYHKVKQQPIFIHDFHWKLKHIVSELSAHDEINNAMFSRNDLKYKTRA